MEANTNKLKMLYKTEYVNKIGNKDGYIQLLEDVNNSNVVSNYLAKFFALCELIEECN